MIGNYFTEAGDIGWQLGTLEFSRFLIFVNHRIFPYGLRETMKHTTAQLMNSGILLSMNSAWAAPVATLLKTDKITLRICDDHRIAINEFPKQKSCPKISFEIFQEFKLTYRLDL